MYALHVQNYVTKVKWWWAVMLCFSHSHWCIQLGHAHCCFSSYYTCWSLISCLKYLMNACDTFNLLIGHKYKIKMCTMSQKVPCHTDRGRCWAPYVHVNICSSSMYVLKRASILLCYHHHWSSQTLKNEGTRMNFTTELWKYSWRRLSERSLFTN